VQFSRSRLLVAERPFVERSARLALRVAPFLLVFFVLAFGVSRLRPHARTPFCFADAATAQDIMHAPVIAVSPSLIHYRPNREDPSVFPCRRVAQVVLGETVPPSLFRAPPVFRI
jgi:hypothetical protein